MAIMEILAPIVTTIVSIMKGIIFLPRRKFEKIETLQTRLD